jgi:hypothetical protein
MIHHFFLCDCAHAEACVTVVSKARTAPIGLAGMALAHGTRRLQGRNAGPQVGWRTAR